MKQDYLQNGQCHAAKNMYFVDFRPSAEHVVREHSMDHIENLIARDVAGEKIASYKDSVDFSRLLVKFNWAIKEKESVVIGTEQPWVESMLLRNSAEHVTTLEYNELVLNHPKLGVKTPYRYAQDYLEGNVKQFDVAASFSSLEHSGLGRYGDPLNPFGDLEAVAQVWCMLKPGGIFFLAVPSAGKCFIQWNEARHYSEVRLKHLTANWEVIHMERHQHFQLVLQKPVT